MEVLERVLVETTRRKIADYVPTDDCPLIRRFEPTKKKQLMSSDRKIIDTLNVVGHESISLCICDPDLHDCPIVFASDGFCNFTGYEHTEIEGKSCRFLQGPDTLKSDVDVIRAAIKHEVESYVSLLNYRKDGTPFRNHFFMSPIHDKRGRLLYFLGVQCFPDKLGDKDEDSAPENMGWGYSSSRITTAARLAGGKKIPETIGVYKVDEETEEETEVSSNGSDEEAKVSSLDADQTKGDGNSLATARPDPPGARIETANVPPVSPASTEPYSRSASNRRLSQKSQTKELLERCRYVR